MPRSALDLARIANVLNKHCVDYVVVGGMAVVLQGGETTTSDVDLSFDHAAQNMERLADALQELAATPKRWLTTNFRLKSSDLRSHWIHLESEAGDIDLIAEHSALEFRSLKEHSDLLEIDGVALHVASIESLITMKQAAGREKDALHLTELAILLKLRDEK